MKNKAAQALGKLAAGKPKNFSAAELKRRSEHMKALNAKRSAGRRGPGGVPKARRTKKDKAPNEKLCDGAEKTP